MTAVQKTKEKTAHTPGPWTSAWVGTRPHGVAVVWLGENTDKRIEIIGTSKDEANARLIAAAPCMLKALKVVLPVLEGLAKERHVMVGEARRGEHRDKLHAAIAKAEGEAV